MGGLPFDGFDFGGASSAAMAEICKVAARRCCLHDGAEYLGALEIGRT